MCMIFCGLYVALMTNTLFLSKPRLVFKIEDTSYCMICILKIYTYIHTIFNFTNYVLKFKSNNTQGSSYTIQFSSFP